MNHIVARTFLAEHEISVRRRNTNDKADKARTRTIKTLRMPHRGRAEVSSHFGELLQGAFRGEGSMAIHGLVALRYPLFSSQADFVPSDTGRIEIEPASFTKARRAAEATLQYLGFECLGGRLKLVSNIPLGIDAGLSTAEVVAAIMAVANACEVKLSRDEVAALAIDTAQTISPIMMLPYPEVLFAHRHGTVLERFAGRLPDLRVVGIMDDNPLDRTITHPSVQYGGSQIEEFEHLRFLIRRAIREDDSDEIGRIATHSAVINQAYLPKPNFGSLLDILHDSGGVGLSVSHSGSAVALLFDPRADSSDARVRKAEQLLIEAGFPEPWCFRTGYPS